MSSLASMAEAVGALLKERDETVAIAESSTGGFDLGCVARGAWSVGLFRRWWGDLYARRTTALLGIDLGAHPGMRPSTEPYALLLANTMRETFSRRRGP